MLTPISIARSGTIASGQVGSPHIANASVLSGDIGIASVGRVHLASGAVQSGSLTSGTVISGNIGTGSPDATTFLRGDLTWAAPPGGSLASGAVQSGHVASGAVQGFFGATRAVASGTLGVWDLGSGAIIAGSMGSGAVQSGNLSSGAVLGSLGAGAFNIASGTVGPNELGSGSVLSGSMASGQVGRFHLASGTVGSGLIASGAITSGRIGTGTPDATTFLRGDLTWTTAGGTTNSGDITQTKLASGVSPYAAAIFISGLTTAFTAVTSEIVSGIRAVQLGPSGDLRIAMASVSGRMPAAGVSVDNALSGIQVSVYNLGVFAQTSSGMIDTSGFGQQLYVGRSGQVVTASGQLNSGGLLSGDVIQSLGTLAGSGRFALAVASQPMFVPALVASGDVASGQLHTYHFASGNIINLARGVAPVNSGALWDSPALLTEEAISGVRVVQITPSGTIRIAMSAVSGRGPAAGLVVDNVLSGIRTNVHSVGFVQYPNAGSGLACDFSGFLSRRVFVGRSGNLVCFSGSYGSGGFASGGGGGFYSQSIGVVVNSGGVLFNVSSDGAVSGGSYSGGQNGPQPFFYGG